ncbi:MULTISPECIES: hypothetical protein [unclassified Microcoleus]|uniref:hypothetical protein n=1 Tax=unclassified Microcoleus TaxID=2642155 RepID=UPI001D3AB3AD|nr:MULTISPECIES: hypothetical protein [unclassified Microcoleus]MCC3523030.1 hypothetical protein [Microcoleus sp. PH2017_20_SFW_D_A]MCC3555560.1 hypothetical protein [Microcoleus sp. PH2017_35_SFW_U_B]TAG72454.1 MAG: hypothetical protein EAZ23_14080 [Oscillatoriales cyanobacterium]TAG94293.1 MAG: hypothetical protein EAZ19_14220 [Oscillatoriales cyanobacterium]
MNTDEILSAFICVYLLTSAIASPTLAANFVTNADRSINASRYSLLARSPCPADLEALVDRLLQDLPSYANRVIVRSGFAPNNSRAIGDVQRQIILAGRPEFEPLPLNFAEALPENASQVFITTLELQYRGGKRVEIQQYHWLFLAKTEKGWELVKIVSRFGTVADVSPLSPAENEKSAIAEAIRLWLRDCYAK